MSAWSEAVWIVNRLQENFDFSNEIILYTNQLNQLNGRVNTLNSNLENTEERLSSKMITIVQSSEPEGNFSNGTVWFKTE